MGYFNLFHGYYFFVLTWWIIDKFEKYLSMLDFFLIIFPLKFMHA